MKSQAETYRNTLTLQTKKKSSFSPPLQLISLELDKGPNGYPLPMSLSSGAAAYGKRRNPVKNKG